MTTTTNTPAAVAATSVAAATQTTSNWGNCFKTIAKGLGIGALFGVPAYYVGKHVGAKEAAETVSITITPSES